MDFLLMVVFNAFCSGLDFVCTHILLISNELIFYGLLSEG
jgi:hypothetical protein